MPEQFDYHNTSDNNLRWAFCEVIGGIDKSFFEDIDVSKPFEILMTVNGKEVKFTQFVQLLVDYYEKAVETTAKELLEQRAADLVAEVHRLQELIRNKTFDLFPDADRDEY